MTVHCFIALKTDSGFIGCYCNEDGEKEKAGSILITHYCDEGKLSELISLGELYLLGDTPEASMSYSKDFFQTDASMEVFDSLSEVEEGAYKAGADILYVFRDATWVFKKVGRCCDKFELLDNT